MATLPWCGGGEHNGCPVDPTRPSPVPHGPPRGVLGTEASGSLDSSGYPAPDRTFYWFQQLCGWDRGDQRTEQGSTALTWQQGGPGGHGSFGRHLDLCVPAALGPVAGWGAASGAGVTVLTVPVGSQLAQGRLARRMWGGLGSLGLLRRQGTLAEGGWGQGQLLCSQGRPGMDSPGHLSGRHPPGPTGGVGSALQPQGTKKRHTAFQGLFPYEDGTQGPCAELRIPALFKF